MPRSHPVLGRLVGLETEYAFRFGLPGRPPGNRRLFSLVRAALRQRVATRPGRGLGQKEELFTENGGAVSYEHLPHCVEGGLIEGSTPECRGPSQLLLYQKAQDTLLADCLAGVEWHSYRSEAGELGLLKNCRDAEDHRYGAQENYEADIASGVGLALYRLGLALLQPWACLWILISWIVQILLVLGILPVLTCLALLSNVFPSLGRFSWLMLDADRGSDLENALGRLALWLSIGLSFPVVVPHLILLHAFAFRRIRRVATAFLISRPILTGAGTVEDDGFFGLSEKGPAIRRIMRWTILPADRCIFDPGNLLKALLLGMDFRRFSLTAPFRRRQRLQLGLSDSNMAQTAELLKVGVTSLVLDMAEDGFLKDAPRPRRAIDALHAVVGDPTLRAAFPVRAGGSLTALEVQRFYHRKAAEYLKIVANPSLEAAQIVRLWGEVLDRLESREWDSLIGRLDWVTKRALLEECAPSGSTEVLKTLDLRYHELRHGYLAKLEEQGFAPVLVTLEEARAAVHRPPEASPAQMRGRWIKKHHGMPVRAAVSWDSVRLGSRLRPKLIPFPDPPPTADRSP